MSTPSPISSEDPGSDRRVVVGVDGSDAGQRALDWAAEEAAHRGAVLEIHTAYKPGYEFATAADIHRSMERILEAATARVSEVAPQVKATTHIHEQSAASALIDASHGAHLLVVGTRGLGGFKGLLLGSVSHQCASHAACPVMLVR
jgi:nucleotide-binding universal stress UspA family protein